MRFYIILLSALLVLGSCTKKLAESIQQQAIPTDLNQSVLLVEKFEYRDPMVFDPYYQSDNDSLQKVTGFTVGNIDLQADNSPMKKEHPLIVKTNGHLDDYNKQLKKSMKKYRGQYMLVSKDEMSGAQLADANKYRYVLMYKPVLHCYLDPTRETFLSYRYMYYFHDRKTGNDLQEVQIFSPDPWKTTKAIVYKANRVK